MSALDVYAASFLDPFNGAISQPKIMDGSVTRSSGLKFRETGNLTLDAAGLDNWIVMFPGLSNGFSAFNAANPTLKIGAAYPSHLGNTTDRLNVRKARLVSQGMRLSILNSSDDNEGYWEAIRLPIEGLSLVDATAPEGEDMRLIASGAWSQLANYNTFQTGRLRDLHRFMFKLNSVAPDHEFIDIPAGVPAVKDCQDKEFDMVIIRLVGRIDAVTPTTLQYDFMANHEVVYKDNTVMARLATMNTMIPNIGVLLDRTRFTLPAIQIA